MPQHMQGQPRGGVMHRFFKYPQETFLFQQSRNFCSIRPCYGPVRSGKDVPGGMKGKETLGFLADNTGRDSNARTVIVGTF